MPRRRLPHPTGRLGRAAVAITQGTLPATGNHGGGVPALTRRHAGLAHGGASASPAGDLATAATGGSGVGTYAVTPGTPAAAGSYTSGASNGGTLAVHPATLV
jgi:hypothetical protein